MTMPIISDQYTDNETRNHVPILAQLGVLGVLLGGIFGGLWYMNLAPDGPTVTTQAPTFETVDLYDQNIQTTPMNLEDISVTATEAYVWDVRGQRALYKKNESETVPLASITKLMTALMAHQLVESQTISAVSLNAIRQEGNSGLTVGESLTQADLTDLALISSSNDAAFELAASVGSLLGDRDPVSQFVAGMNIQADELGLDSLEFKNMTGLDISTTEAGAVGTARDVSFLMEYIIETHPDILTATQQESARIYNEDGAYHDVSNTNVILDRIPNLIGSKTGYTDLAGGNLTVAFDLGNNRPIIVTVLGSTRDARFTDVLTLISAVEDSVTNETYE